MTFRIVRIQGKETTLYYVQRRWFGFLWIYMSHRSFGTISRYSFPTVERAEYFIHHQALQLIPDTVTVIKEITL